MQHSVLQLFFSFLEKKPNAPAIYYKDQIWSYAELGYLIDHIASQLIDLKTAGPIAVHMNRSPTAIATLFACWLVNRAFVALDPKHPLQRRKQILLDAQPAVVVVDQIYTEINFFSNIKIMDAQSIKHNDYLNCKNHLIHDCSTKEAYILYTSGSTGYPKGITILHSNISVFIQWAHRFYSVDALSCVLAATTITFDLSIFEIFVPLSAGHAIFLIDSILDLLYFDSAFEKISLINTVPSAMRALVSANAIPSNVNTINLAGESLGRKLVEEIYLRTKVKNVFNLWGPSESTTFATVYRCPHLIEKNNIREEVPIGHAIDKTEILILDNLGKEIEAGNCGEICIAGAGLGAGYINNPDLTSQKFQWIHLKDGRKLCIYRTGDWGYLDPKNALLHFKGRIDLQIKIRGYRVEPEEIENILLKHNEVSEAAVIPIFRKGVTELAAAVVQNHKRNSNLFDLDIKAHCEKYLPDYMQPKRWLIISKPLPRNSSSKINRQQIAEMFSSDNEFCLTKNNQGLLKTPNIVREYIDNLLDYPTSYNETFINTGGDSLSAVRLLTFIREQGAKSFKLQTILDAKHSLSDLLNIISNAIENTKKDNHRDISLLSKFEKNNREFQLYSEDISTYEFRMWKVIKSHLHPEAYNVGLIIQIYGLLDIALLISAVQRVIKENIKLSSCYQFDENGKIQRHVLETPCMPNYVVDIDQCETDLNFDDTLNEKTYFPEEETLFSKAFNFNSDYPIRFGILKINNKINRFFISMPHTIIDGFGLRALLQQISTYYQNPFSNSLFVSNKPVEISNPEFNASQNYWTKIFFDLPSKMEWPGNPFNQSRLNEDHTLSFTLSKREYITLTNIAKSVNMTVPSYMLGILFLTYFKLGLGNDLIIGCPVANRLTEDDFYRIDNLSNTLPIRTQISNEMLMGELLNKVKQLLIEALNYQKISIDCVLNAINKDLNLTSIFDLMFSYMDFLENIFLIPGCISKAHFYQPKYAKCPLLVSAVCNSNQILVIHVEAQKDKFSVDWLKTLTDLYKYLLLEGQSFIENKIAQLPVLTPAQISTIKKYAVPNKIIYCDQNNIVSLLQKTCEKYADRTAISDHDRQISYDQVWKLSARVEMSLRRLGINKDFTVGILMSHNWETIVVIIGILRCGAHYVPLDLMNSQEKNELTIKEGNINCIVAADDIYSLIGNVPYYLFNQLINDSASNLFSYTENNCYEKCISTDSIAYIIYTSGTTGKPKGVIISHKNVIGLFKICTEWGKFNESDVWTWFHSYAFDFSVWEIFGALLFGGRLIVVPISAKSNPKILASLIEKEKATVVSLTPTAFKNFLAASDRLNHLPRLIIFGGEALRSEDCEPWWEKYGFNASKLINMYGITETTVHATHYVMTPATIASNIGEPLADLGIAIVDSFEQLCPIGVIGEIWICGRGITQGYFNRPELNKERFRLKSWFSENAQRYYRSGDLGVLRYDGNFYYLGRSDSQIKVNGYRVEIDEIIFAIKKMPGVTECLVKAQKSQTSAYLVAYYVAESTISEKIFVQFLKPILPYFAIPTRYCRISEYPLTINGKIDWSKLTYNAQVNKTSDLNISADEISNQLELMWNQVTGAQSFFKDQPFFELGGTSIKAALLVDLITSRWGDKIFSIIDMFRYPTFTEQLQILKKRIKEKVYE